MGPDRRVACAALGREDVAKLASYCHTTRWLIRFLQRYPGTRESPHDLGWIARPREACEPAIMEEVCAHCPALFLSPGAGWGMDHTAPHGAALGVCVCLAVALRCGCHTRRASRQPNPDGNYGSGAL